MVRVKVELWMWLSKELGQDFESPSDMRSILQTSVEDGTTVRKLFEDLAVRYRPISEKVFKDHSFSQYVVVIINDRITSTVELYDRILEEGDKVTVLPMYVGG